MILQRADKTDAFGTILENADRPGAVAMNLQTVVNRICTFETIPGTVGATGAVALILEGDAVKGNWVDTIHLFVKTLVFAG